MRQLQLPPRFLLQSFSETSHYGKSLPFPIIYALSTVFLSFLFLAPLAFATLPTNINYDFWTTTLFTACYHVYQSHTSKEHEMDGTSTLAGTTAVESLTLQSPNENQRPRNPGHFSASNQTSSHYDRRVPTLPEALSPLFPSDHDGVSTDTDPGETKAFDELLASLESDDEKELCTEYQKPAIGEARAIPSVLLETSPNEGLDDAEVLARRKRYGSNMMKEEHRSHLKTFLMFFVGPIQFVMLVSRNLYPPSHSPVKAHSVQRESLSG